MRRRMKPEERRLKIINDAVKVFSKKGLCGSTTREIASACGIAEGVIYQHFNGKEDLFIQALERSWLSPLDDRRTITDREPNGLAALRALLKDQLFSLHESVWLPRLVVQAMSSAASNEILSEKLRKRDLGVHKLLLDLVNRGIEDGSIRSDTDTERLVLVLNGLICHHLCVCSLNLLKCYPLSLAWSAIDQVLKDIEPHKNPK